MDLELGSRQVHESCFGEEVSEQALLHSGFRGPPADTSKHRACFCLERQVVQIRCPLGSMER